MVVVAMSVVVTVTVVTLLATIVLVWVTVLPPPPPETVVVTKIVVSLPPVSEGGVVVVVEEPSPPAEVLSPGGGVVDPSFWRGASCFAWIPSARPRTIPHERRIVGELSQIAKAQYCNRPVRIEVSVEDQETDSSGVLGGGSCYGCSATQVFGWRLLSISARE